MIVNLFGGSQHARLEIRFGSSGDWQAMERFVGIAPYYQALKDREAALADQLPKREGGGSNLPWISLPGAHQTPHLWRIPIPTDLPAGTHAIEVRAVDMYGQTHRDQRSIRILPADTATAAN